MCGIFRSGIRRRDLVDLAGDPAEARRHLIFAAALGHQLHADADAEERPARAAARVSLSASTMPGISSSPRRQSAKAPTPGSTTRSARATSSGIVGDEDRLVVSAFARGALEGLRRRVQIAGAVVDDGDAHGFAPGSGNRPMMSDGRRRARAGSARRMSPAAPATAARRACAWSRRRRSAARHLRHRRRRRSRRTSSRGAQASSATASPPRSRPAA